MATYKSGPSRLFLDGQAIPADTTFVHDFTVDGPDGEHGPSREAAMIAAGAMARLSPADPPVPPVTSNDVQRPPMALPHDAPVDGARGVTADDHE